jgi:tellurite resistance protein
MNDAKVETLKAALGMAFADGELDENESRFVEFLIDTYALTPEEEEAVRSQRSGEVDMAQLAGALTTPEERQRAYETAYLVALLDGQEHPEESAVLAKMREALEIGGSDQVELEARARDVYRRFKQK